MVTSGADEERKKRMRCECGLAVDPFPGSSQSTSSEMMRRNQSRPGDFEFIHPIPELADHKAMSNNHRTAAQQRRNQRDALRVDVIKREDKK